jgi:hypothetical protein
MRPDGYWWQRWLRPGFAHCWAARRFADGIWTWLEWGPQGILLANVTEEFLLEREAEASLVLEVEVAEGGRVRRPVPLPALHHCASLCAHVARLRLALPTPWRLACALRRRGARVLWRRPEFA